MDVDVGTAGFALLEKWTGKNEASLKREMICRLPVPRDGQDDPNNRSLNSSFSSDRDDKIVALDGSRKENEHPLLNSIVLEKVFSYLIADAYPENVTSDYDPKTQRSLNNMRFLRLVCSTWNEELIRIIPTPYICRRPEDVKDLLRLAVVSPVPFIRHLSLKYSELWKTPQTLTLLWNIQDCLKTLEIVATELEYSPFMLLPKCCPSLQKLKISCTDVYPETDWEEELEPFSDIWANPFPSLREVKLRHGSLTKAAVKIIIALLERAKGVDVLEIQTDAGFGRDNGSTELGEELMRRPDVFRRLDSFYLENEDCNGFMAGVTRILHPVRPVFYANLQSFSLIQKSGAVFPPMSVSQIEKTLSKLIQETAPILKNLTIVNSSETDLTTGTTVPKLILPAVMPCLEFLCLGNVGLDITFGPYTKQPPKMWGFPQIFPSLKHFEFWIRIFNDISEEDKAILFQMLFPQTDSPPSTIDSVQVTENLVNYHTYTKLLPVHTHVLDALSKFKNLRSLMLEMDGELLPSAISSLKDLCIEHFTLVYYETPKGMPGFDAAVTGIKSSICEQLAADCVDNQDYVDPDDYPEIKKKNASLVDWKCLSRFNVSYRHGGVFDAIFLVYCLVHMEDLKHLELRHFDIRDNLLIRLIKKLNLKTLIFGNCKVTNLDPHFPLLNHNYGIEDVLAQYEKKETKVSFVGYEGASDSDAVPYYAKLLNHFDYDYQSLSD